MNWPRFTLLPLVLKTLLHSFVRKFCISPRLFDDFAKKIFPLRKFFSFLWSYSESGSSLRVEFRVLISLVWASVTINNGVMQSSINDIAGKANKWWWDEFNLNKKLEKSFFLKESTKLIFLNLSEKYSAIEREMQYLVTYIFFHITKELHLFSISLVLLSHSHIANRWKKELSDFFLIEKGRGCCRCEMRKWFRFLFILLYFVFLHQRMNNCTS